jgi:hypothetical protein
MTTGRAIDHVVLAARELDRAAEAYERLGFTLTPRAYHEDRMGTSNRLAQFQGHNFIELLEVDRPEKLQVHDFTGKPPFFSFGDHNRLAVSERERLSMLVFATDDARADLRRFAVAGLDTFPPFNFERQAQLPDGSTVTVAFTLGFVRSPHMPRIALFVCENRAQQYFWKPDFQRHANGAQVIKIVHLATHYPMREAKFISAMFGGRITTADGATHVSCGPDQEICLLTPQAVAERDRSFAGLGNSASPVLAGVSLVTATPTESTPSADAAGMFIEWISA